MMCVDDHKVQASCDEKTKLGMYPTVEFLPLSFLIRLLFL